MQITVKNEQEWHKLRSTVVTASEAASLVGVNPFSNCARMRAAKFNNTFHGNAYTIIGHLLEPVVVAATNLIRQTKFRLYEEKPDEKVFFINKAAKLGATPDAHDENRLLECKTASINSWSKYSKKPPLHYLVQLQVQLYCTKKKVGWLAIMSTDLTQTSPQLSIPLAIYEVEYCPFFNLLLKQQCKKFWADSSMEASVSVKNRAKLLLASTWRKLV